MNYRSSNLIALNIYQIMCITDKDEGTYRVAKDNEACESEQNIYA